MNPYLAAYLIDNLIVTAYFYYQYKTTQQWLTPFNYGMLAALLLIGLPFIIMVFIIEVAARIHIKYEERYER